ncbi:MAG: SDR family NAD(P)-dependent oxidoreductase, partial [Gemmatimonadota bacterium]|nr:SDR family NAD(P)-dependent oxidoreductase [Gemmatimonadota bacterium]
MELKDSVALITGGSEGIGRAIAEALIAEGARVTITGRRQDALERSAQAIGAEWIVGDVGNETDANRAVAEVIANHGHLDILVNNAGYGL